jgi:nitronate monooxygenase
VAVQAEGDDVVRYSSDDPVQGMTGDLEALALYAGQGVGLIDDVRPAGEIVRELAEEAERTLARLAG